MLNHHQDNVVMWCCIFLIIFKFKDKAEKNILKGHVFAMDLKKNIFRNFIRNILKDLL